MENQNLIPEFMKYETNWKGFIIMNVVLRHPFLHVHVLDFVYVIAVCMFLNTIRLLY